MRSSLSLGVALLNGSVTSVELLAQVGGEDLLELVDRALVDLLERSAAGVVERRAAGLVEQRAHHRRDADQLRRPGDLLTLGFGHGRRELFDDFGVSGPSSGRRRLGHGEPGYRPGGWRREFRDPPVRAG